MANAEETDKVILLSSTFQLKFWIVSKYLLLAFFFYLTLLQLKSSPGFHGDEDEWAFIRMRNNPMQTFTSPLPTTCTNSLGNQKQFDYYAFMQYF